MGEVFGRLACALRRLRAAVAQGANHLCQPPSQRAPWARAADIPAAFISRRIRPLAQLASAPVTGIRKAIAELVDPGMNQAETPFNEHPTRVTGRLLSSCHQPCLLSPVEVHVLQHDLQPPFRDGKP